MMQCHRHLRKSVVVTIALAMSVLRVLAMMVSTPPALAQSGGSTAFTLPASPAPLSATIAATTPSVTIDAVPNDPPGEQLARLPVRGRVRGAPKGARLWLFALGDVYYRQPWFNSGPVKVQEEGRWSSSTHGGYEFVAVLASPDWKPPDTTPELPRVDGHLILAMDRMKPSD